MNSFLSIYLQVCATLYKFAIEIFKRTIMKRKIILMLVLIISYTVQATSSMARKTVKLEYRTPGTSIGNEHRVPTAPIYALQEGHNIALAARYAGETIEVFDGDKFLCIVIVGENGSAEIPANIIGEVEIRLIVGDKIYCTVIDL